MEKNHIIRMRDTTQIVGDNVTYYPCQKSKACAQRFTEGDAKELCTLINAIGKYRCNVEAVHPGEELEYKGFTVRQLWKDSYPQWQAVREDQYDGYGDHKNLKFGRDLNDIKNQIDEEIFEEENPEGLDGPPFVTEREFDPEDILSLSERSISQ